MFFIKIALDLPRKLTLTRIIGGEEVDIKDAPYQVSLQFIGTHICGGSIISELWILTTAYCTL